MRLAPVALATLGLLATPAFADDCADEIKAVMNAAMSSGPVHMETTITAPGSTMSMIGDIVPPKSMQMSVDTNGQKVEMIVLEDRAWMKVEDTWTELPADAAAEVAKSFDLTNTKALDAMTDAKCNGPVTVEGEEYLSYEWNLSAEGADTVNTALVDPEDNLPVSMETQVSAGGADSTVSVEYTYDDSIEVVAPL